MDQKKYDIVLFGATGFTGRLTAEYLVKAQTREDFTWAIAGRSLKKLNALKRQLHEIAPKAHVGVIKADIEQLASLNAMTAQCRVLMTTVGPYIQYGEPVVRACIEQSAHYVDLTGEPEFVDRLRHKFDKKARSSKLKIVNSCGFDSIPHDLGALFTINELGKHIDADNPAEATARESIKLEGFVKASADFSGGTWHSAINAFSRYRKYLKEQSYWKKKEAQAYPQDQRLVKAVRMDVSYRDSLQALGVTLSYDRSTGCSSFCPSNSGLWRALRIWSLRPI